MDFDISTLLPIILGVLYYIFTGAAKKKKKAQGPLSEDHRSRPETLGPPPVSRKPTFEELLEEFTGKSQAEKTPEPELVSSPVVSPKPADPKPRPRVEAQIRNQEPLISFQEYDQEDEVEKEDYREMFSNLDAAKRAFIASEIFNKKY